MALKEAPADLAGAEFELASWDQRTCPRYLTLRNFGAASGPLSPCSPRWGPKKAPHHQLC